MTEGLERQDSARWFLAGYVALAVKYGDKPVDMVQSIEFFSTKIGMVLLVLGVMHFLNIWGFSKARKRATESAPFAPPRNDPPADGIVCL
jgi:hypothetical protein